MAGTLRWVVLTAVLAALIAGAWYLRRPEPPEVRVALASPGPVTASVANTRAGTIKPCRRAHLAPSAGGQVTVLNVTEGSRVDAGAVLLELWHGDLDAQLAQARVEHTAARARAEESCQRAEVAQREARRLEDLHRRDFVSEDALDRAATGARAAAAGCDAARKSAQAAGAKIAVTEAAIAKTILHAPFAGIVAEVNAELGEFLTPSPTGIPTLPAVDLIDDSCLYVSAPIDEVDAGAVALGMPVRVTLDAYPGQDFAGRVRRIAPYVLELEKQARTVEVEAELDPGTHTPGFLVGYSADMEIVLDRQDDVLRIPAEALMERDRVYVVGPDGRLAERAIEVGLRNWEFVQVRGGLERGARVVLTPGRDDLAAGRRVRIAAP